MSDAEFWELTPYEFQLLMDRHMLEVQWMETMAAVQPSLYAEAHRDQEKRKQPYTLNEFTLTGMFKAAKRAEKLAEEQKTPEAIWDKVSKMFGGR